MTTEDYKRRLTAILSADVEGYTRLMREDEEATVRTITTYRTTMTHLIEQYRGRVVDSPGDNILAEFTSVVDAVNCGMEIQRDLAERNAKLPENRRMLFRIGINLGDVVEEGERIYGDGVNIAARIESLAESGGICISRAVHDQIKSKLELEYEDMGKQDVKNIPEPIQVYRILIDKSETGSPKEEGDSLPEKPSIIVLPFDDISQGKDNEFFSDGLTEEIITDLSCVRDLLVISSNSAMTYKGTKKRIAEIAKEVNARYVLEGSVRKAGHNLRITAQLIDAPTDSHLWAEKYSGTLDDIFDIQEKVSRSIVDKLKLKLSSEEQQKMIEHPIPDARAYEIYLKARHEITFASEEALPRALQSLQNAMDIVGENALLYFGLGYAYIQYENIGTKSDEIYLQKAEEYAAKVFELEPESYRGYLLLGLIQYKSGKLQEAVRYLKKALAIEPNDSDALFWLMLAYCEAGKPSAALPLSDRLLQLDPMHPYSHLAPGWIDLMDGRISMALEPCRKGFNINQGVPGVRFYYSLVLALNNRLSESYSLIDVMIRETPDETYSLLGAMCKHAFQRDKTNTMNSLTEELTSVARRDEQYPWIISGCLSLINEKEESLNWLEHAVNRGFINYPYLNEYDPLLENIREEERFKKLMERVKYEWEHFEV